MSTDASKQKSGKTRIVQARMTPEEVLMLNNYAKRIKARNNSEALRTALHRAASGGASAVAQAMEKSGSPADPALAEIVRSAQVECSRIGNNVNQIARRLNAGTGSPDAAALEGIRQELSAIRSMLETATPKERRKSSSALDYVIGSSEAFSTMARLLERRESGMDGKQ